MKADPLADGIMLGGGLLLLWGLAWTLSATGKSRAEPSGATP
jgi:hypothetical protein